MIHFGLNVEGIIRFKAVVYLLSWVTGDDGMSHSGAGQEEQI
jgi:hypothetical protein